MPDEGNAVRGEAFVPDAAEARVLDRVSDGVFGLDREWRYTYLNQAAAEMVGRTPEGLTGRLIWEEFPEAVGSVFDRMYREALYRQEVIEFEDFYEPLGKWFDVKIYPSYGGLTIIYRDATARRHSLEALNLMARRLDEAPCPILAVGADGVVRYANLAAVARLETDDPLVGRPVAELLAEGSRHHVADLLDEARSGGVYRAEWEVPGPDGQFRAVRVEAAAILGDLDEIEEISVVVTGAEAAGR